MSKLDWLGVITFPANVVFGVVHYDTSIGLVSIGLASAILWMHILKK